MTLSAFQKLIDSVFAVRGRYPRAVVLPVADEALVPVELSGRPYPWYKLTVMGIPTTFEDRARPLVRL